LGHRDPFFRDDSGRKQQLTQRKQEQAEAEAAEQQHSQTDETKPKTKWSD
jgi:hypothetical protein